MKINTTAIVTLPSGTSSKTKGGADKKLAAAAATNHKEYQTLDACKPGTDKVYIYGVILDAQFPHKSFKSDKYVCSMKITDQSM